VTAIETRIELDPRVKSVAVVVASAVSKPVAIRRASCSRKTVLYAIAFVVIANAALGVFGENSPRLKDPAYGDKWATLRRQLAARPNDRLVLSLGSSRTLLGFHGQHAENALGGGVIAFNFGTPAAGPVTELVYLRRLLSAGVKPDLLLVEVMPGLCADGPTGPAEQLTLTGERLCRGELEIVERYGFDPAAVRPAWRDSAYLPWSKLRFQLLGRVVPSWVPWNLRFDWSRGADPHGWATPPRQEVTPEERTEREANARNEYAGSLASVSPDGRPFSALRAVLHECHQRGIRTRLVLYPEGSSFRAMYPFGTGERFVAAVKRLGDEFATPLTDARDWLPDAAMYDGHHMFKAGAEAFTARLAVEVIAPALRRAP
jgi:Protein of unknown function (DUF1574)